MANHTTDNEFGKGVTYAAPIDLNAKKPLDSRVCVATISERNAHFSTNRCYPGMPVYVAETGLTYIYDGYETEGGVNTPVWLVLADRDWVSQQIVASGGMTPDAVRALIEEVLAEKKNEGSIDDIRTYTYGPRLVYTKSYDTFSEFPENGDGALIYVDEATNNVYKWRGSEYTAIQASDYEDYFPATGISDIQYVDSHKGLEYIWKNSEYALVNEVASPSEIEDLFN